MDYVKLFELLCIILASGGFWTFMQFVIQRRISKKSSEHLALLGLLHDRIYSICKSLIKQGYVTAEEYRNLISLYDPYVALGGNSVAKALKEEVDKLPMKEF